MKSKWSVFGYSTFAIAALSFAAAGGCSGSSESKPGGGAGGGGGAAGAGGGGGGPAGSGGTLQDGGGGDGTAGTGGKKEGGADAKKDGPDGNDTCATAEALTIGTSKSGVLAPAEDVDFYKFDAKKGQWLELLTQANPDDNPDYVDTVITVFDTNGKQLAEIDDSVPRASTDSDLIWHVPADGSYCVRVEEFSTWDQKAWPSSKTNFSYKILVSPLDETKDGMNFDAEKGNDLASAQGVKYNKTAAWLWGTFKDQTDVDVFTFKLPTAGDARIGGFYPQPSGPDGNGSPNPAGDMWVTDATGLTVIGKINGTWPKVEFDWPDLSPRLKGQTDYLLWVKHVPAAYDPQDYWVIKHGDGQENPLEVELPGEAKNNTIATAEAVQMQPPTDKTTPGFVGGVITFGSGDAGAAADVDYWVFDAADKDTVSVSCGALRAGSGLQGAEVSLRDAKDAELKSATESTKDWMVLGTEQTPITITATGKYYVRFTAKSQDPAVSGNYYRCGIRVKNP